MGILDNLHRASGERPHDLQPSGTGRASITVPEDVKSYLWLRARSFDEVQAGRLIQLRAAVRLGARTEGHETAPAGWQFVRWLIRTGRLRE